MLATRGIVVPDEGSLNDAALQEHLWVIIRALAELRMFLEFTDRLTDRELYRFLTTTVLVEETFLSDDPDSFEHVSAIGAFGEEDAMLYDRYYPAEEERRRMRVAGEPLVPHETPPYDRDRLLPRRANDGGRRPFAGEPRSLADSA